MSKKRLRAERNALRKTPPGGVIPQTFLKMTRGLVTTRKERAGAIDLKEKKQISGRKIRPKEKNG